MGYIYLAPYIEIQNWQLQELMSQQLQELIDRQTQEPMGNIWHQDPDAELQGQLVLCAARGGLG